MHFFKENKLGWEQVVQIKESTTTQSHSQSFVQKKPISHPLWVVKIILNHRPEKLRVLCNILSISSNALFWTEISDVVPGVCWSHFSSWGVTIPCALTITLTFICHIVYGFSFIPWYFSSFAYSFFLITVTYSSSSNSY